MAKKFGTDEVDAIGVEVCWEETGVAKNEFNTVSVGVSFGCSGVGGTNEKFGGTELLDKTDAPA